MTKQSFQNDWMHNRAELHQANGWGEDVKAISKLIDCQLRATLDLYQRLEALEHHQGKEGDEQQSA